MTTNLEAAQRKFPVGCHVKLQPTMLDSDDLENGHRWRNAHAWSVPFVVVGHMHYRDSDDDIIVCICAPGAVAVCGWFNVDKLVRA